MAKTKRTTRDVNPIALDEQKLQQFPDGRQRAIRRCAALLQTKQMDVATVDRETLDYIVKNAGTEGAAFILGLSVDKTRAKLAALRGIEPAKPRQPRAQRARFADEYPPAEPRGGLAWPTTAQDPTPVVDLMARLQDSLAKTRAQQLQRDEHLAVPLITLPMGARFKTPDSPDEGLHGRAGVLMYANDCRARVRFEKTASTFSAKRIDRVTGEEYDVELTFERSGEIDIAARTMVIHLTNEVES